MDYKEKIIALLNSQELSKEQKEKLESIFPELKKSEDEWIREELLAYLKNRDYDIDDKWIAWLEKQGKQKHANKVEPKFHEGDWVFIEEIKGYKNGPFQIKSVNSYGYSFDEYHTIPFMYEDLLSKWTIQDAKDGDVLYENDTKTILIFKSQTCGWIKVYCDYWISKDKYTGTDHADYGKFSEMKLIPATKEQRDLLFQKMKEAGYKWDAEHKQLKKIEQKTVEWSEEDESTIDDIICYIRQRLNYESEKGKKKIQKCENWLKSLKERYTILR